MIDRRPADGAPYATVLIKRTKFLVQTSGDFETNLVGEFSETLHNECVITAQFSVYGSNAYQECVRLSNAIHSSQRWTDLWRYLGYAGQSELMDVSMSFGAQMQQRCLFDVSFYAQMGSKFPADFFTNANMYVEVDEKSFNELMPPNPEITGGMTPYWNGVKLLTISMRWTEKGYFYCRPFTYMPAPWPIVEVMIESETPGMFTIDGNMDRTFSKTDAYGSGNVEFKLLQDVPQDSIFYCWITLGNLSDRLTIRTFRMN
jgi:hypothetical protein